MFIGYMRPTQTDVNCEEQHRQLMVRNCSKIFHELHTEAENRTGLEKMLAELHQGEKVVVTKLFSIADSTHHLTEILKQIEDKGAFFHSLAEGIDTSNLTGYNFAKLLKHMVDFQSEATSEKTKKGLLAAKKKGVAVGRPKKPDENVQRAIQMYQTKEYELTHIKEKTGISKSTLYRYMGG